MIPQSRSWATWSAILGAGISLAILAVPLPLSWHTNWRAKLLDLGHIPLFAALTMTLSRVGGLRPATSACIGVGLAGVGEALQALATGLGRSGDFGDWLRGTIGCLCFLLWEWHGMPRNRIWRRVTRTLGYCALAAWPILDAGPAIADAAYAYAYFPVLADFSTPFESVRFVPKGATFSIGQSFANLPMSPHAIVAFSTASREEYPGVDFFPPWGDWRNHRRLTIEWESPDEDLELTLAVKDFRTAQGRKERFNLDMVKVRAGRQRLVIPLVRIASGPERVPLDLSQVFVIQCFVDFRDSELRTNARLVLHRIYLE